MADDSRQAPDRSRETGGAPVTLQLLSAGLCSGYGPERRNTHFLQIVHRSLIPPRLSGEDPARSFGLGVLMRVGNGVTEGGEGRSVRCTSSELPFVDHAFRCVILYHVIGSGEEAELEEACRVLVPGGDLLIVGINRTSWAGMRRRAWPDVPRLHGVRVAMRLHRLGMRIEERQGAGLFGGSRPATIPRRWQALVLPVADVLLLRARHRQRPLSRVSKLKDVPAGMAPTAIAGR